MSQPNGMLEQVDVFIRNARRASDGSEIAITVRDGRVTSIDDRGHLAAAATGTTIESDPSTGPREVIDAQGSYLVPSLVDLHVHAYPYVTPWGVAELSRIALSSGVTTVVDAGSAGAATVHGLREAPRFDGAVDLLVFLNLSRLGLATAYDELALPELMDVPMATDMAKRMRGWIVGIKARLNGETVGRLGSMALDRALLLAEETSLPLMVDIYSPPPPVEQILERLRPGDILTHCFVPAGNSLAMSPQRILMAKAAQERGVILDLGHGVGSFSFKVADAMAAAGVWPDTISTDLHAGNVMGPVFDLPTTMSKMLAVGMPIDAVLAAATVTPRRVIGGAAGEDVRLEPVVGQTADLALLGLDEQCDLVDVLGERRAGPLLRCRLTMRAGRIVHQDPKVRHLRSKRWAADAAGDLLPYMASS